MVQIFIFKSLKTGKSRNSFNTYDFDFKNMNFDCSAANYIIYIKYIIIALKKTQTWK